MKMLVFLSFTFVGLALTGCGSSSSNNTASSPTEQTAIPQSCYTDASYRQANALTVCASVPNVDQRCYTDSTFRVNNLNNGVCSGTTTSNTTNTNCVAGTANCYNTNNNGVTGIVFPTQTGATSCGSCNSNEQVVIDAFGGTTRCVQSSSVTGGAIYFGGSFGKIDGREFETFNFSISGGSMFVEQSRSSAPNNTCQGDNAAFACRLGSNDCSTIFAAQNATCIPQPNRNYGFCGVVNANGTISTF